MCQSSKTCLIEVPSRMCVMSAPDFETLEENFRKEYGTCKSLVQLASSGDAVALADLGFAWLHGVHGFAKNGGKAFACLEELFRCCTEIRAFMSFMLQDSHDSRYKAEFLLVFLELASMLDDKLRGHQKAVLCELWKMGAEQGIPEAQYNLAQMYQWGEPDVIRQNRVESFKWFKMAAGILEIEAHPVYKSRTVMQRVKCGVNAAQANALKALFSYYNMGECPEEKPQRTKALDCLTKAAEMKDPVARRVLGKLYMTGGDNMVDINPDRACRWLHKAVESGDQEAVQVRPNKKKILV